MELPCLSNILLVDTGDCDDRDLAVSSQEQMRKADASFG